LGILNSPIVLSQVTTTTYYPTSGVSFDGTNDAVSGANGFYCDFGNGSPFTAECFAQGSQTSEINFLTTGTTNTTGWELGMGFGVAGRPHFLITDTGGDRQNFTATSATMNNGSWYHIAGVRDPTNGSLWLYLNGSLVGSATIGTAADGAITPGSGLRLAKRWTGGTDFLGSIDEVRVSKIARYTGTATINNWGSVEFSNDANTNVLWHFNEGTGTATNDANNNIFGSFVGNTAWINGKAVSGFDTASTVSTGGSIFFRSLMPEIELLGSTEINSVVVINVI
jgi:hypothetical protein